MDRQRLTPQSSGEPIKQVLGFIVEGQTPSPITSAALAQAAKMDEGMSSVGSGGSERLVLIPPAHPKFSTGEVMRPHAEVHPYHPRS